jgi:hypothetical protein
MAQTGSQPFQDPFSFRLIESVVSERFVRLPLKIVVLLVSALLARAADELPRGRVLERVTCAQAPAQAYALFLPPT